VSGTDTPEPAEAVGDPDEPGTGREIGRRRIPAGDARSVVVRRSFDVAIADLWGACTDPKRIGQWFIEPKGDLTEGGSFSLEGNASGPIVRCEAPSRLTLGWVYGEKPDSEVELRLTAAGAGATTLELEHATIDDGMLVEVAVGWEMALDFLGAYLRGALPPGPVSDGEEFEPSPEMMKVAEERGGIWGALVAEALQAGA
jgi:uncharacterized protein YndB with AHSA1/START domain